MTANTKIINGVLNQSRKEANFLAYYLRDKPLERLNYLKAIVARNHKELLFPFIAITHVSKFAREIHYTIDDGLQPKQSGKIYQSRSQSDFMNTKTKAIQQKAFKNSIADLHHERLMSCVNIITGPADFRTVQYTITITLP